MIDILLRHKEITRKDMVRFGFRSLIVAPIVGVPPGLVWGVYAFGPVEDSYVAGATIGIFVGIAFSVIGSQLMGMGTIRGKMTSFISSLIIGTIIILVSISISGKIPPNPEWIKPLFILSSFSPFLIAGFYLRR